MPLVAEFNSTMSVREVERVTERVVDVLQNMGSALAEGLAEGTMDRYDVARTIQKTPSLRDEFGIDQTIDNMETYYEVGFLIFSLCLVHGVAPLDVVLIASARCRVGPSRKM